ncbi:ATP-binding protein [mine drainage metagenome]|uniref:ATP-binding protein n=2 Tax=mine drainage metagenome TaxID=410659 RepID=T0YAE1_9ZZZZ
MGATALVSGGKDSIFAASLADQQGVEVDELLVLEPDDNESWMYHTPNLGLVRLQAEAWGKSFRSVRVPGPSSEADSERLETALRTSSGPIVAGAIASSYQWSRLLKVASRLNRRAYLPLWGKEAATVVRAEISAGLDIRIVHVAAEPLTPDLLGLRLDPDRLADLECRGRGKTPVNVAGEGGEYETLVVDAPFFARRIVVESAETVADGSAARWVVRSAHLAPKP